MKKNPEEQTWLKFHTCLPRGTSHEPEFACAEIGFDFRKLHGKHGPLGYIAPNVDVAGYAV